MVPLLCKIGVNIIVFPDTEQPPKTDKYNRIKFDSVVPLLCKNGVHIIVFPDTEQPPKPDKYNRIKFDSVVTLLCVRMESI